MLMKSKNKVLHKEDWEAIIAKPKSISKLPLGKLFLLNKKFVEQHYGFSHVKGSIDETLEFYDVLSKNNRFFIFGLVGTGFLFS